MSSKTRQLTRALVTSNTIRGVLVKHDDAEGGEVHLSRFQSVPTLEIVSPMVEDLCGQDRIAGRTPRGTQFQYYRVIRGDAAFAGRIVVMETFQMSQTQAYRTGGTLHIVLNNQIGLTGERADARNKNLHRHRRSGAGTHFHVNGDDPEAVVFVTQLAVDYRNQFNKDVVIDLVCYRRRGHNEADEPSVANTAMYEKIKSHPSCRRSFYAGRLINAGLLTEQEDAEWVEQYRVALERDEPGELRSIRAQQGDVCRLVPVWVTVGTSPPRHPCRSLS